LALPENANPNHNTNPKSNPNHNCTHGVVNFSRSAHVTFNYARIGILGLVIRLKILETRMWANAQRDGRPAGYRWRTLFNAAKFG